MSKLILLFCLSVHFFSISTEIESILKQNWAEGKEQLKCVLSKNYTSKEGKVFYSDEMDLKIKSFFEEFAIPIVEKNIDKWE